LLHNAIVTIYSQVVHQPSGIRRFWFGVSLLSPLRPILRNGNPLLKFLGNAFTGERILQRSTPRHLWATDQPRMCYPTCQQLPWCPAHGNRCARSMCRVNLHHTFRHHITTSSLFRRLNLLDIDSYYHNRLLRWAGHVARMPILH